MSPKFRHHVENDFAAWICFLDCFSSYSRLKEVFVKLGDKILAKEKIGVVLTDENDNKTELHFEIWKGYDKQDPSKWLFKAY